MYKGKYTMFERTYLTLQHISVTVNKGWKVRNYSVKTSLCDWIQGLRRTTLQSAIGVRNESNMSKIL